MGQANLPYPAPQKRNQPKQGLEGLKANKKVGLLHFLPRCFKNNTTLWSLSGLIYPSSMSVEQQSLRPLIPKQNPAISLYTAVTKAMSFQSDK